MGSQHDAQKNHIKDFEEEFDDKSEIEVLQKYVHCCCSKVFNCAYALLCDRNMLSTQGLG